MKTLTWKRTNWTARNFIFSIGQEIIGQLTFAGRWNFNAVYADTQTQLTFTQKGFWDRDILITRDGQAVGDIHNGLFGEQSLRLVTGERFIISTSLWEQEAYWKTEKGATILTYKQAVMSSMEKGSISIEGTLPNETEKLLISSGLFIRQVTRKRIGRTVAVMIPILAAGSRL